MNTEWNIASDKPGTAFEQRAQLELATPLSWLDLYTKGGREAAEQSYLIDCNIRDDKHGNSFFDQVQVEAHEEAEEHHGHIASHRRHAARLSPPTPAESHCAALGERKSHDSGFCNMLDKERAHKDHHNCATAPDYSMAG